MNTLTLNKCPLLGILVFALLLPVTAVMAAENVIIEGKGSNFCADGDIPVYDDKGTANTKDDIWVCKPSGATAVSECEIGEVLVNDGTPEGECFALTDPGLSCPCLEIYLEAISIVEDESQLPNYSDFVSKTLSDNATVTCVAKDNQSFSLSIIQLGGFAITNSCSATVGKPSLTNPGARTIVFNSEVLNLSPQELESCLSLVRTLHARMPDLPLE